MTSCEHYLWDDEAQNSLRIADGARKRSSLIGW
ncbi:hypothetical protein J2S19_004473 [Metabacillus malikii]|uniref:Uncharacterized protein n=1 Tax=Metabacillus malikii TaxID=1504265 RepID=A0ABT9ZLI8_9BACI|nr:hypothetical protein [Metabacillus malikii]